MNNYLANRLFEWVSTVALLGVGLVMFFWPHVVRESLFRYMLDLLSVHSLIAFYTAFGLLRVVALIANGRWKTIGPILRMIGAFGGAMLWAQMGASLLIISPTMYDGPSPGVAVYLSLVIGELYSVYRSSQGYS